MHLFHLLLRVFVVLAKYYVNQKIEFDKHLDELLLDLIQDGRHNQRSLNHKKWIQRNRFLETLT